MCSREAAQSGTDLEGWTWLGAMGVGDQQDASGKPHACDVHPGDQPQIQLLLNGTCADKRCTQTALHCGLNRLHRVEFLQGNSVVWLEGQATMRINLAGG